MEVFESVFPFLLFVDNVELIRLKLAFVMFIAGEAFPRSILDTWKWRSMH